jgi:hypothetical protein
VTPGDYSDKVFTVKNVGGGLLSGAASSVASPFQIISNASYSLGANATDTVTIRFTPTTTSDIVNNESAVFSGGGGYALALSGNLDNSNDLADGAADLRDLFLAADANNNGCVTKTEATNAGLATIFLDALYPIGFECWGIDELLEFELGDLGALSTVYVDFEYNPIGLLRETGVDASEPFNTLLEGFAFVKQDGSGVVRIDAGISDELFTGSNTLNPAGKVTLNAIGGTVRIGEIAAPPPAKMTRCDASNGDLEFSTNLTESPLNIAIITQSDPENEDEIAFNSAIYEGIIPNTMNADGTIALHLDGRIAIRLRDYTGLQFETLWAGLHPEHSPDEITLHWLPANASSADNTDETLRDIWVLIDPTKTWFLGDLLTIAAGGITADGADVATMRHRITVETTTQYIDRRTPMQSPLIFSRPSNENRKAGIGRDAILKLVWELPSPDEDTPKLIYRILPNEVFDTPQRIWIPVASSTRLDDLKLQYYKQNEPDQGWHNAEDIEGFLGEPEPVSFTDALGNHWLGVVVKHAGLVALSGR